MRALNTKFHNANALPTIGKEEPQVGGIIQKGSVTPPFGPVFDEKSDSGPIYLKLKNKS